MKKDLKILKAKPEFAREITLVNYKTWLTTYPNKKYRITAADITFAFKKRLSKKSIKELEAKIRNPKNEFKRFVAKFDNRIVGICNIAIEKDKNRLASIYVLPKYQGRGIGLALWKSVSKFIRNKNKTILNVATYNVNAINFYKKLGFVKIGKRFTDEKFKMRNGALIPEIEMVLKKNN